MCGILSIISSSHIITLLFPNADLVIEHIIAKDILYMRPGNAKQGLMKRNLSPCHTLKGILMRCVWELTLVSIISKFDHWPFFLLCPEKRLLPFRKWCLRPFCAMKSYRDHISLLWNSIARIWEFLARVSRRQWKADVNITKSVLSSYMENKTAVTKSWRIAFPASDLGG